MFEGLFQPMHLLVILGIALLVFGPKKLPELGKGLGEGIRSLKRASATRASPPKFQRPRRNPTPRCNQLQGRRLILEQGIERRETFDSFYR